MIDLIFPDGSKRPFDDGVTGRDVAASIAPSLAKKAVLPFLGDARYIHFVVLAEPRVDGLSD